MDTDGIGNAIGTGMGLVFGIGMAGLALKATSNMLDQVERPPKEIHNKVVKAPKAQKLKIPKLEVQKLSPGTKNGKVPEVPKYGSDDDYFSPANIIKRDRAGRI